MNKNQCKTCVFHDDQEVITPERLAEIQQYLIKGTNHICHTTNKICRGGRDYQLQIFYRMGFISEPTDGAIYKKIKNIGIEVKCQTKS